MDSTKKSERKVSIVDFKHDDFEFSVKLAKYVDEHTDIMESIRFQRKCLDFVNEITDMVAVAYSMKLDKETEQRSSVVEDDLSILDRLDLGLLHPSELISCNETETDPETTPKDDPETNLNERKTRHKTTDPNK